MRKKILVLMKLILRWCCFWYPGADSHGHTSGAFWPWGTSEKCQHFPEQQSIDTLLYQAWWFHENLKRVLLYSSTTFYCGYIQFVLQLSSLYLCIWKRTSHLCVGFLTCFQYYMVSMQVVSQYSSLLAPMAVDAVLNVIDPARPNSVDLKDIKVLKKLGGTVCPFSYQNW